MEEDIPFDEIPTDLQRLIVEKMDHFSFFALWRVNRYLAVLCELEASKIVHPIDNIQYRWDQLVGRKMDPELTFREEAWEIFTKIPCRIHADIFETREALSDELAEYFIEEFKKVSIKVRELGGRFLVSCSLENFDQLLKVTSVESIWTQDIPGKYFVCSTMKMMKMIRIEDPVDLLKGVLPAIKTPDMYLTLPNVSNEDLNEILKQWRRKERKVEDVTIHKEFTDDDIDEIVEGLDANLVWSEEYHRLSDLSSLDNVEYPDARLYCLFHYDNIDDIFALLFIHDSMCFHPVQDFSYSLSNIAS